MGIVANALQQITDLKEKQQTSFKLVMYSPNWEVPVPKLRKNKDPVLIDFLLTVKAATLIFISERGSAISSA